jgi:hypothetical protein
LEGQVVEITGLVQLLGNEPFTELVLSDEEGRPWYIAPEDRPLLAGREQQRVRVRGTLELRPLILADGTPVGTRRILRGVSIVP